MRDIHFYSRIVHFKNGAKQCYQLRNNQVLNLLHIKVTLPCQLIEVVLNNYN